MSNKPVEPEVQWLGPLPALCDTCGMAIKKEFYDAKTRMGPWGNMCPTCFVAGPGLNRLGQGWGQRFEKQKDGRYLKTGG